MLGYALGNRSGKGNGYLNACGFEYAGHGEDLAFEGTDLRGRQIRRNEGFHVSPPIAGA